MNRVAVSDTISIDTIPGLIHRDSGARARTTHQRAQRRR
jgi:hypothetical protein